jgi:AcrR family transcriptional regulator
MPDAPTRRQDTRTQIIESAARLLSELGPSAVTTRGVAEAAGVQAPAIYRLFGDKDGLLEAVAEHVMRTHVSSKAGAVAAVSAEGGNPVHDLRVGWESHIEFGLTHAALFHLLSDPARAIRSAAYEAGLSVLRSRVHRVAEKGRLRVSEDRAVGLMQAAGAGTITTLLATPTAERDPGLAEAMFQAVLRQILTEDTGPTADASFAVALRATAPQLDVLSTAERGLFVEWLDRIVAAQ